MVKHISGLFALLILGLPLYGQRNARYPVSEIPPALLEKSVAVVRLHEETLEIQGINRATRKVRYAVTILNKAGEDYGVFHEYYDKFVSIGSIQATIYDRDGAVIEKVKASDIKDYSATSSFSIYEDNRQKYYPPQVKGYPYTVEYEYGFVFNGLFRLPGWTPLPGYDISVENSIFVVSTPVDYKLNYREFNLPAGVNIVTDGRRTNYEWKVTGLLPVESEEYAPFMEDFMPYVLLVPIDFEFDGYSGNMSSWDEFGAWQLKLLEGRDKIPQETGLKVMGMVDTIKNPVEKVKSVYKYVQGTTRYVSIQVGIGGWQPMTAEEVANTGYGDCKALTNYTMSLLKLIGIRSLYTVVRADKYPRDIKEEFVSNQANHVFLCVPMEGDTIWLECTSQTHPFGYIGNFTDDRKVFVITEDGGKIVRSKEYPQDKNSQVTNATVNVNKDNSCRVDVTTVYSGLQYDNISGRLHDSYEDNQRWLYNNLGLTNFKILAFDFSSIPDEPIAMAHQDLEIGSYCSGSGNRVFVQLNMFNRTSYVPRREPDRKRDVVVRYPYIDIDSIRYIIPDGYRIESIPEDSEIITDFGEYRMSIKAEGNEILYTRERKMNKGTFLPESYEGLREFFTEITKSDRSKLVLVKN